MSCPLVQTQIASNSSYIPTNVNKLTSAISTERVVSGNGQLVDISSKKLVNANSLPNPENSKVVNISGSSVQSFTSPGSPIPSYIPPYPQLAPFISPSSQVPSYIPPSVQVTPQLAPFNSNSTSNSSSSPSFQVPSYIPSAPQLGSVPNTFIPSVSNNTITPNYGISTSSAFSEPPRCVKWDNTVIQKDFDPCAPIMEPVSTIDQTLGVTKTGCSPKGAPWQVIITIMIGSGLLLYTILVANISDSRRQFSIGVIILWTLLWAVLLWSLWRRCYTTVIWWMLLFSMSVLVFFFIVMVALDLGSA